MALVEIKDLSFTYPGSCMKALDSIDLSVEEGQFVLIAGASGCGKSTLLRMLKTELMTAGIAEGSVMFGGESITALGLRRQAAEIGFVMQDPEMQIVSDKVFHELAFGLESLGTDEHTMRMRVAEMANFFGIQDLMEKETAALSGGQKQLVCLASVMVMQPRLLLLDEPTSQLDPIAAGEFFDTLSRINLELGTTIIITEHRTENLFPIVDRCVFMDCGRIVFSGSPRESMSVFNVSSALSAMLPTGLNVYASLGEKDASKAPLSVREAREYIKTRLGGQTLKCLNDQETPSPAGETLISVRGAWYRYERDGADVLSAASFDIRAGELACILGGNGAGKTTAVMCAAGLYKPYRGKVLLEGKNIFSIPEKERFGRTVAVLPQEAILTFSEDSILKELEAVRKHFKLDKARLDEIVELMQLDPILGRNPYDVSGGELQRAAIAKLLLPGPRVLILDEATKGMDAFFKQKFGRFLKKLASEGTAVVLVSHDIEFCCEYADRLMMFFSGGVIADGSVREVLRDNCFYTTAAARIARGSITGALTADDIIYTVNGEDDY